MNRPVKRTIPVGDDRYLHADFSPTATTHNTVVTGVSWEVVIGSATLGEPSPVTGGSAVLLNTGPSPETITVKATATMADNQTFSLWFIITTEIPKR